jgi:hypothetical protein
MKTHVYVDGFNLYYGALKGTEYKWLNVKQLIEQLLPATHKVSKIKYFTARVSGAADPDAPKRQQIYLNALETIPEIELHFGSFLSKSIWRPTLTLPVADRIIHSDKEIVLPAGNHLVVGNRSDQRLPVGSYPKRGERRKSKNPRPLSDAVLTQVHTMEEKGSDVNLAAHLLNDAWKEAYEAAVVVSNDTDLVAPIRMVTTERRKAVFLVSPGRQGASKPLVMVSTFVRHIRQPMLAASQFPAEIPNTTVRKPPSW